MRRFAKSILLPYIEASGYGRVCEIGSEDGVNLDRLLDMPGMRICSIDPCVRADLERKYAGDPRVRLRKGRSLQVLPTLRDQKYDCILIDGDHNWYTVFHELVTIHEHGMLAANGTIFLHDVCWPYARRDMYYDPEAVPAGYRQPASRQGILRGSTELSPDGMNAGLWNATREGGPRNGVLTAIEDFLAAHPDIYRFFKVEKEWGLGVMLRRGENRAAVARLERRARRIRAAGLLRTAVKAVAARLRFAAR